MPTRHQKVEAYMNESRSMNNRFPSVNDHLKHQQALRSRTLRHQDLDSPEAVVSYLVAQIQRKYHKGHRLIEAKIGFPMSQIGGLTLPAGTAGSSPDRQQRQQLDRLNDTFKPLINQALDLDHLIGETTIQLHGKGCTLKSEYQVRTPKQFRQ